MTEKQTTPPESSLRSDDPVVTDEELARFNEWSAKHDDDSFAAEAARRTVDTSSPVYDFPTQEAPAKPAERKKLTGKDVAWGAAASAMLVTGVTGIVSSAGGQNNPERGEVDPSVNSITVSPDARFRQDPITSEANVVLTPNAEITIDPTADVRVDSDTDNGTWYGLNVEDVAAKIPDAASINDKDGIIWVNEAGVDTVEYTPSSADTLSGQSSLKEPPLNPESQQNNIDTTNN